MKIEEIQDFEMLNDVHLCNSCYEELPNCDDKKHIIFGTGKSLDNICACSSYNPVHIRNYDAERDIILERVAPFKENLESLNSLKIR